MISRSFELNTNGESSEGKKDRRTDRITSLCGLGRRTLLKSFIIYGQSAGQCKKYVHCPTGGKMQSVAIYCTEFI